jgi:putative acetyltransferase
MEPIEECAGLEEAIRSVLADAFGRDLEAQLVDELRREGSLAISLAAGCAGNICGYVALPRLQSPPLALALAPVGVSKAMQGRGIGTALIRHAIRRAQALGCRSIFVLGAPAYYERFGFSAKAAAAFPSPCAGPHFMALHLAQRLDAPAAVIYPRAFDLFG